MRLVLQLFETFQSSGIVPLGVVDVRRIVRGRRGVYAVPVLHLGEFHQGLVGLVVHEERVAFLEDELRTIIGTQSGLIHLPGQANASAQRLRSK